MVAVPQCGGLVCTFNDQHRGLVSQEQGQENDFAMVKTQEATFSKVLNNFGI